MKPTTRSKLSGPVTAFAVVLAVPAFLGCAEGNAGQAQETGPDTVVAAILETAATENEPTPRGISPRLSPREQDARPIRVSEMGYNEGSPDAPLKIMEFTDFGCGYCRSFHTETYPRLKEIYVDGGFVEWKHVPFVLGRFPHALEAGLAAECAGEQDQFFPMHRRLFQDQQAWRNSDDPIPLFVQMAGEEGLDGPRLRACLEGGWREGRMRMNLRLAGEIGVEGTPTFVIDNRPLPGALPLEQFRELLDVVLVTRGITPPGREEASGAPGSPEGS